MTTFTIHAEDLLANTLRSGANAAGSSINLFIKNTLAAALGLVKVQRRVPSFLRFAGCLETNTGDELQAFVAQADFSKVDAGDWS